MAGATGPLSGMTVLELCHFIAGPYCTRLLADMGATVIKIETPGEGDPIRTWGEKVDGRSLWWSVHARNKKSVTVNVKDPRGRDIVLNLVKRSRIVVENYRPGQIERWGLGPDVMAAANPRCVLVRISGYGQTGPNRDAPAFGVIGEAMGGMRYLTNHPADMTDLPSVRVGFSIGDSIAGMYGAMAALAAVHEQDNAEVPTFRTIDVALTESVLSLLEGCLPEFGKLGMVREPQGSRLATASPSNAYPTKDGAWVLIAANSNPLFARLSALMKQPELAKDPRFLGNHERVQNMDAIDRIIGDWTRAIESAELVRLLAEAQIPATKIFTIEDIAADKQFLARGMIQKVPDPYFKDELLHPGAMPIISGFDRAAAVRWTGPDVGEHTGDVLGELGLSADEIAALKKDGVV
ncbi:formyl-coenzyme A transferase [Variibacter gotjawalensis]|uniref:Formyl-coenzyme A transferase n=1 Tax=Variibacter gotjawalensis TaxID=1333996 RepID=A0A0S3PSF0_9BRAD|nr:CaiB/BaiF CoA-transferase family protein [Variibacter gotjawalensis]NIK49110.1 formyl-CoA transferase [Variibacter gotjawalensis]RZS50966.1 crotonobetainyl-CoA:carnitine CoA-transferase CaiB-like acyl-CoA transferase [Variibacter gotjawalensis]BAT58800.1 formyl-coenzyme A transferase [Variibacter gotjawalensis]